MFSFSWTLLIPYTLILPAHAWENKSEMTAAAAALPDWKVVTLVLTAALSPSIRRVLAGTVLGNPLSVLTESLVFSAGKANPVLKDLLSHSSSLTIQDARLSKFYCPTKTVLRFFCRTDDHLRLF